VTTGTLRWIRRVTVLTRRLITRRVTRLPVVDTGRTAGTVTACARYSLGTANSGKRATATESAGSGDGTTGASTAARTDAPMTLT
jgi:hypothetical protein